jgi:hypothetical protein
VEPTTSERWVSVVAAAAELGISIQTVRRRMKKGELTARQIGTSHGPMWEVCLTRVNQMDTQPVEPELTHAYPVDNQVLTQSEEPSSALVTALQTMNDSFQEQLDFLRHELEGRNHEIATLHEEARRRDHLLALLGQRLTQLEAPSESKSHDATVIGRSPWWRFWGRRRESVAY